MGSSNISEVAPHLLQKDEIKWLADQINHGKATESHARYGIHIRKLQRIAKNERDGVPRRCKHIRPPVFSEKAQEKLKSACAESSVQLSEQEYEKLQIECLRESLLERNKLPPDVVQVYPNTNRSWDKKLGLRKVILNKTTEARLKACNNVRNAISFCAMIIYSCAP